MQFAEIRTFENLLFSSQLSVFSAAFTLMLLNTSADSLQIILYRTYFILYFSCPVHTHKYIKYIYKYINTLGNFDMEKQSNLIPQTTCAFYTYICKFMYSIIAVG